MNLQHAVESDRILIFCWFTQFTGKKKRSYLLVSAPFRSYRELTTSQVQTIIDEEPFEISCQVKAKQYFSRLPFFEFSPVRAIPAGSFSIQWHNACNATIFIERESVFTPTMIINPLYRRVDRLIFFFFSFFPLSALLFISRLINVALVGKLRAICIPLTMI